MKILKIFRYLAILLLLTGVVAGYYGYQTAQESEFGIEDQGSWQVNGEDVSVVSSFWIDYQGPIDLDFDWLEISAAISLGDIDLVSGEKKGVIIEEGNNTVTIETELNVAEIDNWWVNHMSQEEISTASIYVGIESHHEYISFDFGREVFSTDVNTNIEGTLNNALNSVEDVYQYDSGYPGSEEIEIVSIDLEIGEVTESNTELIFTTDIRNLNDYPIPSPDFEGSLVMNNLELLDWDRGDAEYINRPADGTIAPGQTGRVTFAVEMSNEDIPEWFISHVDNNEFTEGHLDIKMFFDFDDAGQLVIPGDGMRCPFEFQTDILVDEDPYTNSADCDMRGSVSYEGDPVIGDDDDGLLDGDRDDDDHDDEEDSSDSDDGSLLSGLN